MADFSQRGKVKGDKLAAAANLSNYHHQSSLVLVTHMHGKDLDHFTQLEVFATFHYFALV